MEEFRRRSSQPDQGRPRSSGFISLLNRDRFPGFHEDFSTTAVSACVTVRYRRTYVTHQCL